MRSHATARQLELLDQGRLDEGAAEDIRAHLDSCTVCRDRHKECATNQTFAGQLRATMKAAGAPAAGDSAADSAAAEIPGYRLIREVHRGGQGVVYEAFQESTRRRVAIKVMLGGPFAGESSRRRFEREAELAAMLTHPNIVAIHDSGVTSGNHYFIMDFVEGVPLDEAVGGGRMPFREVLKLFGKVCGAVNYAHQRGVIHRDLKPSNILVDEEGDPRVLDFGLAKQTEGPDRTVVSMEGQLLGSPPYMAPEQARGEVGEIDVRTDGYSLGVVLYKMLTGRHPYRVTGPVSEVLLNVAETEPERPSTLSKEINDEVETILLKSISKEKERRYQSVGMLADDVGRFLAGEPIEAKRDSGLYVLKKTVLRHKWPVMAAALFVLLIAGFGAAMAVLSSRIAHERDTAIAAEARASRDRAAAMEAAERELAARRDAEARKTQAEAALYSHTIGLAYREIQDLNFVRARENLDRCDPQKRNWEWGRLDWLCQQDLLTLRGHQHRITSVAFGPDGKWLASASEDQTLRIWNAETGDVTAVLRGHSSRVTSVAISRDGKRLLSGSHDQLIKVWDVADGNFLRDLVGHEKEVTCVAFGPGDRAVSGSIDQTIRLWDVGTGQERIDPIRQQWGVMAVAFSPDGRAIAAGTRDGTVTFFDADGQLLRRIKAHADLLFCVTFSPDGRQLATGSKDETIRTWDVETGNALLIYRGHERHVLSLAYTPDGRMLISGGADRTIKLWDVESGAELATLRGHSSWVTSVACDPAGERIASGSGTIDQTVKLWRAQAVPDRIEIGAHDTSIAALAFSDGGFVSAGADGRVSVWDEAGDPVREMPAGREEGNRVALSSDGRIVVTSDDAGGLRVTDLAGPETQGLHVAGRDVAVLAVADAGKAMAAATRTGTILLWRAPIGQSPTVIETGFGAAERLVFSPGGGLLAAAGADVVRIWNVDDGIERATIKIASPVTDLVFGPGGERLASTHADGTIRLSAPDGEPTLRPLEGHAGQATCAAFSPDGLRLATGGEDETVKIWDPRSGRELLSLKHHSAAISRLAFRPDGMVLASGDADGTIVLLPAAAWR